ncbi:MAG TPA: cell wall hydrolase [Clostridia bacterium]|nr:cell wall hydrolase [Clostridia bacterium]
MIHGEARGESYLGKLAVGAVVVNRLKSPLFPDTLAGVIYERRAFTCVDDGQIDLEADEESYRAAMDALNEIDPTNGCLFYYNPRTATSRWMYKRPTDYTETIGNHVFMK